MLIKVKLAALTCVLLLAAPVGHAEMLLVDGSLWDIVITDPVATGETNLAAFDVIVRMDGATQMANTFSGDGMDGAGMVAELAGVGSMQQEWRFGGFVPTPTLNEWDQDLPDGRATDLAPAINDSYFYLDAGDVASGGDNDIITITSPFENEVGPSAEPPAPTAPGGTASNLGTTLAGAFSWKPGEVPAGPDWMLAHIEVVDGSTFTFDARLADAGGNGETLTNSAVIDLGGAPSTNPPTAAITGDYYAGNGHAAGDGDWITRDHNLRAGDPDPWAWEGPADGPAPDDATDWWIGDWYREDAANAWPDWKITFDGSDSSANDTGQTLSYAWEIHDGTAWVSVNTHNENGSDDVLTMNLEQMLVDLGLAEYTQYDIRLTVDDGVDGTDSADATFTTLPEPGSMVILLSGGAVALFSRRRRRRS